MSVNIVPLVHAEESIEYVAEHLMETPMDLRYQAFPLIPANHDKADFKLQLGYADVGAGRLTNKIAMASASSFVPIGQRWGLVGSVFYDDYAFSGKKGGAVGEVLVVDVPDLPRKFDVNILRVDGGGRHAGGSLALTYSPSGIFAWQVGMARADLDIQRFSVNFVTTSLNTSSGNNFQGRFDYAGKYTVNSQFFQVEIKPQKLSENFTYHPHLIIVRNSPRVGFKGRFIGPSDDLTGNTDMAGNGKHIPDNYMGVGVNLEHTPSGIAVDLGATLYTYLLEPSGHGGIDSPLYITMTIPLF